MHDLKTKEITFSEKIGSSCGEHFHFIKVKEVAQNLDGNKFAVCYLDDGIFCLRTFTKEQRYDRQIKENEVRFNGMEEFNLNNFTVPNDEFSDPFMTCCFITDDEIFVNFFYNHTQMHYHFMWNVTERKVKNVVSLKMDCIAANFP